ncbi:MAG: DEAD/DEAH box helicase family protein [Clostridia bacterium]|nr:DEAD/DEAH box helicase family protein [Clostridia bacterium]
MSKIKIKTSSPVIPMIYAYTTPGVVYNEGWTKIGYTERDVDVRIKEQTQTANIRPNKEWQDIAIFTDGKTRFTDTEFHSYLEKHDIERKEPQHDFEGRPEWFKVGGRESYKHFTEFRNNMGVLKTLGVIPYTLRNEQKQAVRITKKYFSHGTEDNEFLWNAKPRFGKTLSTYDLCKKLNAERVLVVTNRPAIANSWYEDYVKFLGTESGYYFVSEVEGLKNKKYVLERKKYIDMLSNPNHKGSIEFVSLQDLKGSIYFGGQYDKLKHISDLMWDILVIDEAHEGVDTYKTDVAFDKINRKYTLHLSGTPFKALSNEKFSSKAIYNWTYADEQQAKRDWSVISEEENPYENLPQLNLFTYKMSDIVRNEVEQGADFNDDGENEEFYWDLNEFFRTNASGKFVYDDSVDAFLESLTSQRKFPFSTDELRAELKHTLWLLKYVNSAKALARKLKEHPIFREYEIVLAAGDGRLDDEGNSESDVDIDSNIKNSYDKVVSAIKNYEKTITISVGQLTTGITIPEWTGVMMLSSIKSPALYMQASFRAQNPCIFNINGKQMRKENAYIFDFDPARTLTIIEEVANGLFSDTADGRGDSETRKKHVRELLNFFPVYGEDDEGEMVELDAEKVLSIPRAIHAKEVVRKGFMSNFLFQNIGNIFNAPKEVIDIIQKFTATKETLDVKEDTKKDLSLDDNADVKIPEDKIIGIAGDIFGPKLYGDIEQSLIEAVDNIEHQKESKGKKDEVLDDILNVFRKNITDPLINTAKENYGKDLSASAQKKLAKKINDSTELTIRKKYGNLQIENNKLENERSKEVDKARASKNPNLINEINEKFDVMKKELEAAFSQDIQFEVNNIIENSGKTIIESIEVGKKERERNSLMDNVRDHLRGFSRTIPSFIMAYGDQNTTLENFDSIIPDEVFREVTSISLEEFRKLRDGFDYKGEDGETKTYSGFFDSVVFNDSIKEFLNIKNKLSNYFEDDMEKDVFDYIPPQKTNQIFTPKNVVKEMVDLLEKENPGCFDNPEHTFMDLYMKSGLYITEIVKRLYRSDKMKKLFPDDKERLNHIFGKQVYGLAPTEIIYKIAKSYILGFDDKVNVEKHNFKLLDATPYAKDGTLEVVLDKVFD